MAHETTRSPLEALERLLWAFQAVAELLLPEAVLDEEERSHVSTLLDLVTEGEDEVLPARHRYAVAAVAQLLDPDSGETLVPSARGNLSTLLRMLTQRL